MASRLLSLVALPLALIGHLLFWPGSGLLMRSWQQFGGRLDIGALALTVAGIVLVAAAVATVAVGSLGAVITGIVHLAFSLLVHLLPFDFRTGAFSPGIDVMNAVRGVSIEAGDGMFLYFPPGAGAVTGAILLGAGLAADRRRASVMRLPVGVGAIVGVLGLVLAIAGGAGVYVRQLVTLSSAEPLDVVMLYAGVLLVGAVAFSTRWSSAGALVTGAVAVVAGLAGLASPAALVLPTRSWLLLSRGLELAGPSGILLLIGVLLVVAGLAVRLRARAAAGADRLAD
jgi:hypothetical protein